MFLGLVLVASPAHADTDHARAAVKTSRGDYSLHVYAPSQDHQRPLLLLMSGEGGWRNFDQRLAGYFQRQGFWVGGIDCLKYFWKAQDDRQALAADVRAYALALARAAGRAEDAPIILAGFSFGADLAPWIAGGGGWGSRIVGLIMLGPDEVGSLQFRVLEVFGFEEHDHIFQVSEALTSSQGIPKLFIHGGADEHSSAPMLAQAAPAPKKLLTVPDSDHHFNGHEEELRHALIQGVQWLLQGEPPPPIPREQP
jgi:type IV secretory pathway VirJ component